MYTKMYLKIFAESLVNDPLECFYVIEKVVFHSFVVNLWTQDVRIDHLLFLCCPLHYSESFQAA
jgi:hypothetical protein